MAITIVGVGTRKDQLTLGAAELMQSGRKIILHTERCGAADYLREKGIPFESLDNLYEAQEDFDEHAGAAAEAVRGAGDAVYCVLDVRDESARLLAEEGAEVIPGPPCEGALAALCCGAALCFSASDWENARPSAKQFALVREIDSRELACEVKLRLMEAYPDDAAMFAVSGEGAIRKASLYELDRLEGYDHRFAALICPAQDADRWNDCDMRDLVFAARSSDEFYRASDADEPAALLARAAGAIAYAEDRGEYAVSDAMLDARAILLRNPV